MTDNANKQSNAQWPPFEDLEAYFFPEWLKSSVLDFTGKYSDKLIGIYIGLYATAYYDDNNNIACKGNAWINFSGTKPTEDELDFVPGMRRIERRAEDMWDYLPIDADEEGNLNGEFSYGISQSGIYYCYDESEMCGEATYTAEAKFEDNAWKYEERITIPSDISETALAALDVESILNQINPGDYGFKEWPHHDLVTIQYNEEEEVLDIIVKGGGLFVNYERKVA